MPGPPAVRAAGGTVLNFVEDAASRIEPAWERIGQALRHTPVLGADESGIRTLLEKHGCMC